MKIKVNEKINVEVKITKTMDCPAGTAYHTIDYLYEGICIHSATTGAIFGLPNPIAMLDRSFTFSENHSIEEPQPVGDAAKNRTIKVGSVNGKPMWWEELSKTHRQAILEAVDQIVPDTF